MKQRDSFIFYRSFYEAIENLDYENQGKIYHAICAYNFTKKAPELSGVCQTVWILVKPQLDANIKRFENGNKQKLSKTEAKQKQNRSKRQANNNVNGNVNNNDNYNFKKELLSICSDEKLIDEFLLVRKKKKAVNTETAFNGLKSEILKSGLSGQECIKMCVEKSWSGFKAEWVNRTDLFSVSKTEERVKKIDKRQPYNR